MVGLRPRVAWWNIFKPKNPDQGKFFRVLQWNVLAYFMASGPILQLFGILNGSIGTLNGYLVHFSRFGKLYQDQSGNPAQRPILESISSSALAHFELNRELMQRTLLKFKFLF
jgi:hypothetical protein